MFVLNCLRISAFVLLLALPFFSRASGPDSMPPVTIQIVNGYLVAHIPSENVTVVGRPSENTGSDGGWATWAQRGQLLWRGAMTDSQGRVYNVRILPGYVAPWEFAKQGWTDATKNLGEYAKSSTWTSMGDDMKSAFKWGWKTSLWEFGLQGSKDSWKENFETAKTRTTLKTFGWPVAYPWAIIASAFETAVRVPIGSAGALVGTALAGVGVPVVETAWPATKAVWNGGVNGVVLPVAAWSWQTVAAPPGAALASAPSPSRADGTWMKLEQPKIAPAPPIIGSEAIPENVLADLAHYASETAKLDADRNTSLTDLQRRETDELEAVRARYTAERKVIQDTRFQTLQVWLTRPENREAIVRLAQQGGDGATIRAATETLVQQLKARGFSEAQARAALNKLALSPIVGRTQVNPAYDKTDPLRGAIDTIKNIP